MSGNSIGLSQKLSILSPKIAKKTQNTRVCFLTKPKWHPRVLKLIFVLISNMGKHTKTKTRTISIVEDYVFNF